MDKPQSKHVVQTHSKMLDIQPFGTWTWKHKFDTCSICKENINHHSLLTINETQDIMNQNPHICIGECSHVFHKSCLTKWLQFSTKCPLCNEHWQQTFEG